MLLLSVVGEEQEVAIMMMRLGMTEARQALVGQKGSCARLAWEEGEKEVVILYLKAGAAELRSNAMCEILDRAIERRVGEGNGEGQRRRQ